jgi:hypothetical protein
VIIALDTISKAQAEVQIDPIKNEYNKGNDQQNG